MYLTMQLCDVLDVEADIAAIIMSFLPPPFFQRTWQSSGRFQLDESTKVETYVTACCRVIHLICVNSSVHPTMLALLSPFERLRVLEMSGFDKPVQSSLLVEFTSALFDQHADLVYVELVGVTTLNLEYLDPAGNVSSYTFQEIIQGLPNHAYAPKLQSEVLVFYTEPSALQFVHSTRVAVLPAKHRSKLHDLWPDKFPL